MRSVCTEDTVKFPALSVLCCPTVTLLWTVGECETKDDDDDDDDIDIDDVEDGKEVDVDLNAVGGESVVDDVFVVVVRNVDVVNDTA